MLDAQVWKQHDIAEQIRGELGIRAERQLARAE
jgi:hypothetical protein